MQLRNDSPARRTVAPGAPRPLGAPAALGLALLAGCAAGPPPRQPAVDAQAARAMAQAMTLWRDAEPAALDAALDAAEAAIRFAPDWVAPRRFVDDRMREELLGPNALERHREVLARDPRDAAHLYLAARLEGSAGQRRMEEAARAEPALSWAQHGLAWKAFLDGQVPEAIRRGEGALVRARDPFERANFSSMLARYLRADEDHPAAAAVLEECLADTAMSERLRVWIQSELAYTELSADDPERRRRGVRRALGLIASGPLSRAELDTLVSTLRISPRPLSISYADIELALAERALSPELGVPTPGLPGSGLDLRQWDRGPRWSWTRGRSLETPSARRLRSTRFAFGDPQQAVEDWLAELPRQVLDDAGMPREPRLARLVLAARALAGTPPERAPREVARELGDALIDAGWFREARSYAARVPAGDLELAEDLGARALAGRGTLDAVADLLRHLPQKRQRFPALVGELPADGPAPEPEAIEVRDLDALLRALTGIFERAHRFLGGETRPDALEQQLRASPRIDYGVAGALLHPGQRFSRQDEELGRGRAGDTVRGVSEEFWRLGRFAVIGDMTGSKAPDGTVLQLLSIEERSGEHLGVEWAGTVAWCEGADFHGGAARTGVEIGGAALHEGYFIDIEVVRGAYDRWSALRRRFEDPEGARRVSRALAVRGVPLGPGERWASSALPLGEADRMRLAVMADRAEGGEVLGEVRLEELVELTAVHEEGHLCDRARFYPISGRFWRIVGFVLSAGVHPARVAGELEYRAQLVALCVVPDPRLGWVEILQAAEGGNGPTPHAAAYTRLLGDLLKELEAAWEREPLAWRELDPERMLVQQVHRLSPEQLRGLALGLARRRGLVEGHRARP